LDDRAKIIAVKAKNGRIFTAPCDWITAAPLYKSWNSHQTGSQLLWISSVEERGKTMMAILLSQKLEKAAKRDKDSTVLYFFIDRQDKRDTAVHVLRGLMARMTKVNEELAKHLLEEYDVQKEALFSKDAIEALWRVFVKMVTDPKAGQVYCIIDGLNCCTDESLRRLISRITNFFLDDSQANVDAGSGTDQHCPSPVDPNSAQKPSEQKRGAGLNLILVSRENPEWMVEQLSSFHRIDIGAPARKFGGLSRSASRAVRRPPTLASVAASLIQKQRLDTLSNSTGVDAQQRSTGDNRHVTNQPASSFSNDPNTSASIPTRPSTSTTNASTTVNGYQLTLNTRLRVIRESELAARKLFRVYELR
jgi:hypothetical protein